MYWRNSGWVSFAAVLVAQPTIDLGLARGLLIRNLRFFFVIVAKSPSGVSYFNYNYVAAIAALKHYCSSG